MNGADNLQASSESKKETGRLEAFSDGVFAIAITLLALELKIPSVPSGDPQHAASGLASALRSEWPSYFAFVTSFLTILIMWMHHHALFKLVRRTDATLLFANGFLLLAVTAVPFPTAIVADYINTPAATTACTFYAAYFTVISLGFTFVRLAAFRKSVLDPAVEEAALRHFRQGYVVGPPLYFAATIVAPFSPWISMGICTVLWIYWAIMTRGCYPTN